jgi:hypothetical protein
MFRRYAVMLLLLSGLGALGASTVHAQQTPIQPSFPPYQGVQYDNVNVLVSTHVCYVYPSTASDPQASDGNPDCYYNSVLSAPMAYSLGGAAGTSGLGSAIAEAGAAVNGTLAYSQQVTTAIDSPAIPFALDNPFLMSMGGSGVAVAPGQPVQISWAFQDYMTVYRKTKNNCGFLGLFICTNDTPSTVQLYGTPTANFDLPTCASSSGMFGSSPNVCNLSGTVTVNPTQSSTYTITAPISINEAQAECNVKGGGGGGSIRFSASLSTSTLDVPTGTNPSHYCTTPPSVSNPSTAFQFSYIGTTTGQGKNSSADKYLVTYTSSDFGGAEIMHTTLSVPVTVSGKPFALPSFAFASNPITVGQSTAATWSVTNATNCALSNSYGGVNTGAVACTSQTTPTPTYTSTTTDTYTLQYTDSNGTTYFPTYMLVVNDSSSSCNPSNLLQNGCPSQPGPGTSCPANSFGVYPGCSCDNGYTGNGQSGSNLVCTLNVNVPRIPSGIISAFTATPSRVLSGGTSNLTWSTSNMASCLLLKASDNSSVSAPLSSSGTQTPVTVTRAETYTLSCLGIDGNTYTSTASVKLTPTVQEL